MKKLNFVLLLSAICSITYSQMKVLSMGAIQNFNQTIVYSNANNPSDGFDITGDNSNLPSGYDLIWGMYRTQQPNSPGLLTLQSMNGAMFTVRANGNVGIFNSRPSVALEIGTTGTNHQIKLNGTLLQSSDERLKENIADISNSWTGLKNLRSVSYNFKEINNDVSDKKNDIFTADKDGKIIKPAFNPKSNPLTLGRKQYGFLAQDVEKVFPELVYKDADGMLSVDYIGIIPLLLDAIKEQQTQLDNLTTQIKVSTSQSSKAPSYTSNSNQIKSLDENSPIALYQNNPNPFSQSTEIKYYLPKTVSKALLCIYDLQGKQLKQITIAERGEGSQTINGAEFSAGIYLYGLIADGQQVDVKRMILTE